MIIKYIISYLFWFSWSIIVGGLLIAGPILAPLAFNTMPLTVSAEIAHYAHSYSSTLFTLFFVSYLPIVAVVFVIITVLEQIALYNKWREQKLITVITEILLLAGNIIWIWLAILIVPEMESMVMSTKTWNDFSVREAFTILHLQSQTLSEIGLGVTLILPWFSRISRIGFASLAN